MNASNYNTIVLNGLKTSNTINDIKRKLQVKTGIPQGVYRLEYQGKPLDDDEILSTYAIRAESEIHCHTGNKCGGCKRKMKVLIKVTTTTTTIFISITVILIMLILLILSTTIQEVNLIMYMIIINSKAKEKEKKKYVDIIVEILNAQLQTQDVSTVN